MKYEIRISPLSKQDGGGFAGIVPDLPGCMSDGETPEGALENTRAAIKDWISVAKKLGRKVPEPGSSRRRFEKLIAKAVELARKADFSEIAVKQNEIKARQDRIERELRELKEIIENLEAQTRFSEIVGLPVSKSGKLSTLPKHS